MAPVARLITPIFFPLISATDLIALSSGHDDLVGAADVLKIDRLNRKGGVGPLGGQQFEHADMGQLRLIGDQKLDAGG